MKRYRLTARAQLNGVLCEPGHIFTLADGELGPHKAMQKTPDLHAASIDAVTDGPFKGAFAPTYIDVPLYEEVDDAEEDEKPAPVAQETPAAEPATPSGQSAIDDALDLVDRLGETEE